MSPSILRPMLVASFILALIGGGVDLVITSLIPEPLIQAQAANDADASLLTLVFIVLVGLVAAVCALAAYYGLFMFKPWAPRTAVIGTLLSLFLWPAFGANVYSGWSFVLIELSNLIWGATIVAVYLSPLKEQFVVPC